MQPEKASCSDITSLGPAQPGCPGSVASSSLLFLGRTHFLSGGSFCFYNPWQVSHTKRGSSARIRPIDGSIDRFGIPRQKRLALRTKRPAVLQQEIKVGVIYHRILTMLVAGHRSTHPSPPNPSCSEHTAKWGCATWGSKIHRYLVFYLSR